MRDALTPAISRLRDWPRRRWLVAGLLVPALGAVYLSIGVGPVSLVSAGAALTSALLAALVLASYVPWPGDGRRLDIGCSPCAVMAAATVLGSLLLRATEPQDGGLAVVAVLLLGFGLVQRLTDARTCSV